MAQFIKTTDNELINLNYVIEISGVAGAEATVTIQNPDRTAYSSLKYYHISNAVYTKLVNGCTDKVIS